MKHAEKIQAVYQRRSKPFIYSRLLSFFQDGISIYILHNRFSLVPKFHGIHLYFTYYIKKLPGSKPSGQLTFTFEIESVADYSLARTKLKSADFSIVPSLKKDHSCLR